MPRHRMTYRFARRMMAKIIRREDRRAWRAGVGTGDSFNPMAVSTYMEPAPASCTGQPEPRDCGAKAIRYVVKNDAGQALANDLEIELLINQCQRVLERAKASMTWEDDGNAAFEPTQRFVETLDDALRAFRAGHLVKAWAYATAADSLGRDVMRLIRH